MILLSLLDKFLRLFGTSRQQLRWQRHIREQEREQERERKSNLAKHISYRHKVCEHCGEIIDRQAKQCPYCNQRVASWWTRYLLKLGGRLLPESGALTSALLVVNALVFIVMVFMSGELWSMDVPMAIAYGANYGPLMSGGGEWWRLFTCHFLHVGGLMHIAFNMMALAYICPLLEERFGTARTTTLYFTTALASAVVSHLAAPIVVSGGASGAVSGLIGAGIAAGHLQANEPGRQLRNTLLKWTAFIMLFGLLVPGIDNWAHAGGLFFGVLWGAGLLPTQRTTPREQLVHRLIAWALVGLCITSLVLGFTAWRDYPHQDWSRQLNLRWNQCYELITQESWLPAAEACDHFTRMGFYHEPVSTSLAAQLWHIAGEEREANRLLNTIEAYTGRRPSSTPSVASVRLLSAAIDLSMSRD